MVTTPRAGGESEGSPPTEDASGTRPVGESKVPDEGPSLDVIFNVLQNRRRRLVLTALAERDGTTTLGELAEYIAGIENDKPPSALDSQERKRVYVGLYQSHLPRMDDAGAIRFDEDRGSVEAGPYIELFREYLRQEARDKTQSQRTYLGLAGASYLGAVFVALYASGPVAAVVVASVMALVGGVTTWYAS